MAVHNTAITFSVDEPEGGNFVVTVDPDKKQINLGDPDAPKWEHLSVSFEDFETLVGLLDGVV